MSPRGNPREHSFKLVLTEEERAWLMFLAHEQGQPAAAWVRQLIRREWNELKEKEDASRRREFAKFLKQL